MDIIRSYCSSCKNNNNHNKLFIKRIDNPPQEDDIPWFELYMVLECCGCGKISFRKEFQDETMIAFNPEIDEYERYSSISIYPPVIKGHSLIDRHYFLPANVNELYVESINALSMDCLLLAVSGFRSVIEATCIELGITKGELTDKINNLYKKGHITKNEAERLHAVRFMGNDSLHQTKKPNQKQLLVVLDIIEHLLSSLFLFEQKVLESKVETIINNYEDFLKLLKAKIHSIETTEEIPLKKILGFSSRRLDGYYGEFESKLIEDINSGSYKELTLGTKKIIAGQKDATQHFIIV
jgi:hypothetical protein